MKSVPMLQQIGYLKSPAENRDKSLDKGFLEDKMIIGGGHGARRGDQMRNLAL